MGLFNKMFGGDSNKESSDDGLWLRHEKETDMWIQVAEFNKGQPIELAEMSPFNSDVGTFCVLRSFSSENQTTIYLGCIIPKDQNDLVLICVDRIESANGKVLKKDDWTRERILHREKLPSISQLIAVAKNKANFYDWKTTPPYVFHLIHNMSKG